MYCSSIHFTAIACSGFVIVVGEKEPCAWEGTALTAESKSEVGLNCPAFQILTNNTINVRKF